MLYQRATTISWSCAVQQVSLKNGKHFLCCIAQGLLSCYSVIFPFIDSPKHNAHYYSWSGRRSTLWFVTLTIWHDKLTLHLQFHLWTVCHSYLYLDIFLIWNNWVRCCQRDLMALTSIDLCCVSQIDLSILGSPAINLIYGLIIFCFIWNL